jgi:hypothetical protein
VIKKKKKHEKTNLKEERPFVEERCLLMSEKERREREREKERERDRGGCGGHFLSNPIRVLLL